MNPFDEIAVEEAIKMREAGKVSEVVAMSIGPKQSLDVIRNALAMGADKGIHVITDMTTDQQLQPLAVAKIFRHVMEEEKFDLALLGKQSIDDDYVQTGQILASLMDIPSATFSSGIEFSEDNSSATVTREVDFGLQQVDVELPAIFTVDLRLNTPRFANVQGILKAKKKPVQVLTLADLGLDVEPRLTVEAVEAPVEREGGIIVENVDELLDKLRNEAKVI